MSLIVMVPKKNSKVRVCVDLKKIDAATIRENYPYPLQSMCQNMYQGKKLTPYQMIKQAMIMQKWHWRNNSKTTVATSFGIFTLKKNALKLTNAQATFQTLMCIAFKDYLHDFLQVFIASLCVHINLLEHIKALEKVLRSENCTRCPSWHNYGTNCVQEWHFYK